MNFNGKALGFAGAFAFVQALPITYYAQNPKPEAWGEFFTPVFIMAYISVVTGNALFAHLNFRSNESRTRFDDNPISSTNVLDLLKKENKK